mgnify:CR=1 FL=1
MQCLSYHVNLACRVLMETSFLSCHMKNVVQIRGVKCSVSPRIKLDDLRHGKCATWKLAGFSCEVRTLTIWLDRALHGNIAIHWHHRYTMYTMVLYAHYVYTDLVRTLRIHWPCTYTTYTLTIYVHYVSTDLVHTLHIHRHCTYTSHCHVISLSQDTVTCSMCGLQQHARCVRFNADATKYKCPHCHVISVSSAELDWTAPEMLVFPSNSSRNWKIGRASCRERV